MWVASGIFRLLTRAASPEPRPPNVVPFLGQIPFIGQIFRLRKSPVTMYHESLLLILPTVSSTAPETMRQLEAAGLLK